MGVGGDEGGICYVGPPAEAEPTVAEGSKGEGGADGVEGVGERRESADDAEQGSVIGGLGAVEGWTATIDAAKEVGDAVLEGLESKDVLDMQAGAKPSPTVARSVAMEEAVSVAKRTLKSVVPTGHPRQSS